MAKLNIPTSNREGLSAFLALSNDLFEDFVGQVANIPATVDIVIDIADSVTLPDIKKPELDKITRSILSLALVRWTQDADLDGFLNDVVQAIAVFNVAGATPGSKERLRKVLSLNSLMIGTKASSIVTDYQRTMHGTKVLTDIRYVFQTDPAIDPYGAVLIHLLKLTYHEDGEHKEFYVAMDEKDLGQLQAVLIRAQAKAKALRDKLVATGTKYLGSEKTI